MDDPSTPHRSTDRFKTDTSADTSADIHAQFTRECDAKNDVFFA